MQSDIRGEVAARRWAGTIHQTRPAHLIPENFAGDEPDQIQDLGHRNNGPDFSKANPWHDWRPRAKKPELVRAAEG